ncbi:hypothetical protein [Streptomyces sp. NPDC052042]|uniref:hypothetical protein n=1 Tax=Streptomyces sp. NPDC052042 TaxID=3365683 RepID=UPI0037D96D49
MTVDVKHWLRDHAGKVLVCGTGALLALSVFSLGTSLLAGESDEAERQAARLIVKLENDLAAAQDALENRHEALLTALPGVDTERVRHDAATGRSILLSLTDSSASSRDVKQTQVLLDARYEFLDNGSRVLTEFIPEWMTATGSSRGVGTVYTPAQLDIDVSGIHGQDYSYAGVTRMDPVAVSGPDSASEYVVFTYRTAQDGTVTSLDAYRASDKTRDLLAAAGEEHGAAATGRAATPTTTATATRAPTPTPTPAPTRSTGG